MSHRYRPPEIFRSGGTLTSVDRRRFIVLSGALTSAFVLSAQAAPDVGSGDRFLGRPDAKVLIVEFVSPTCPVCKRWRANVFPMVKASFIDAGLARLVIKELPMHNKVVDAAVFAIARCVPQEAYFSVLDAAFERQAELDAASNTSGGPISALLDLAAGFSIGPQAAEACLRSDAAREHIANVRSEALANGVRGTPTLFIDGVRVTPADALDPQIFYALVSKAAATKR